MSRSISQWAEFYTKNMGFKLVPIEPGRKFPRSSDWGNRTLNEPLMAGAFYESKSDWNMGVALGPSRVCSLDIDCMESFKTICAAFGVDLDALTAEHPTIQGSMQGMRVMFSVPEGVELPYVKLNWRPECDPDGSKHKALMAQAREAKENGETGLEAELREQAKPFAMYTVFELRSACDGSQKQDVLPPSWHTQAEKQYEWITKPTGKLPEPPSWLLTIWAQFKDKFEVQFKMACPWANAEEVYEKKAVNSTPVYNGDTGGFSNVVSEFNRSSDINQTLSNYGYKQVSGKRWLSPCSSTGLAGVTVFDSNKCWIHHASDPLCSDESGRPVAPFDLVCYHEHGGDFKAAVTSLARDMGLTTSAPRSNIETHTAPRAESAERINEHERAVDIYSLLPHTDEKGRPLKHIDNLAEIIKRLGAVARYNVMRKEEELIIPGESFSTDNEANASIAYLNSACSLFNFTPDRNREFITYLADKNQYSPVVEWITSKPWDGLRRLNEFYDTVQTAGCVELKNALIKRWMLSAVCAAFNPEGVNAQGILVFQGAQDLGKTSWLLSLVPTDVNKRARMVRDGMHLDPKDKDSVKKVVSHWLVELGELDGTFRKADVALLKGFVTSSIDTMRLPYAPKESTFARRTVFFGSVNPKEFLQDETGNRRYWTIEVTGLNSRHEMDMQQVWAEFLHLWRGGEQHFLSDDEKAKLNTSNEDFEASDPIEERLMGAFNWEAPAGLWDYMRTTDVLLQAGVDRPTRADVTKAAIFIRKMNGNDSKRCGAHGRRLKMPPAIVKSGFY